MTHYDDTCMYYVSVAKFKKKVKQNWGWVEKSVAYKKSIYI